MNGSNLYDAKINELKNNGVQILTREDILKNPDIMFLGENRGIPFDFIEGETITLPENPIYWAHKFHIRKEEYVMLKCLADSDKRGVIEIPAPIFCRVPALEEERQLLFEDNDLGKKLSEQMPDVRRLDIVHECKKIHITQKLTLHQDSFSVDEAGVRHRIPDSPDLPNRRNLTCYKFVAC